ncbi:MAG: aldehyde dehydrogenase family protein [Gammaproteobacteria bacterium]
MQQLIDPVTALVSGAVRFASFTDLDVAVAAARIGLEAWSGSTLEERREVLRRLERAVDTHAGELTLALSHDIGCPVSTASFVQVQLPLRNLRAIREGLESVEWQTTIAHSLVRRVPIGVVACITPWNAPVHQILAKVAGVIAAGGTVVLKPSEIAPRSVMLLAGMIDEIELPPGVFNFVWGDSELGQHLVTHPGIDMVSFTGSSEVGRKVMVAAGAHLKPVALELGGKSAGIVLRDADLQVAVPAVFRQAMLHSGQTCVCQSRLLVPRERMAETMEIIAHAATEIRTGDPLDPHTNLGPLATAAQFARVGGMVERARAGGARSVLEVDRSPAQRHGFFFPPTVLADVDPASELGQREVFGPVVALMGHDGDDDAVRIANSTPFGLSGAVWSADASVAERVARRLRTGQVSLNGAPGNLAAPAGGFGSSGFGRENGRFSIEAFTAWQAIHTPVAA